MISIRRRLSVNCGFALISFLIARNRSVEHATNYAVIFAIIFYAHFLFIKSLDDVACEWNDIDNTRIKLLALIIIYAVITCEIYKYAHLR